MEGKTSQWKSKQSKERSFPVLGKMELPTTRISTNKVIKSAYYGSSTHDGL